MIGAISPFDFASAGVLAGTALPLFLAHLTRFQRPDWTGLDWTPSPLRTLGRSTEQGCEKRPMRRGRNGDWRAVLGAAWGPPQDSQALLWEGSRETVLLRYGYVRTIYDRIVAFA